MKRLLLIFLALTTYGCSSMNSNKSFADSFLWLEEIEGEKSLNWVKDQNKIIHQKNEKSKNYTDLQKQALSILEDKDKIPYISMRGNYVYNFWQDTNHIKGIWRRTSLSSYKSTKPKWETLIDVDKLSKSEKENWVFKGSDCFSGDYNKCLIYLSRGGKDATVMREFDIKSKEFVKGGFELPEAKSSISWKDKDSLYVGTDFGKDSLTTSGYPRVIKLWHRNTPLAQANTLLTGKVSDISLAGYFLEDNKDQFHTIYQGSSFFESKKWFIDGEKLKLIPLQNSARLVALFRGHLIVMLKKDWILDGSSYLNGSVLAIKSSIASSGKVVKSDIKTLMIPNEKRSIQGVSKTKDRIIIRTMENVRGKIYEITFSNGSFSEPKLLKIKSDGDIRLAGTNRDNNLILFFDEGFLRPRSLNLYNLNNNQVSVLKSLKSKFNTEGMIVEQRWSQSKDGTKIPYFIVGKKSAIDKGNAPTELYGYGGFNISLKPYYSPILGKLWLEKGGVYVLANIRGGGEFGPQWHQSAMLKNKHKSYEDFISVAEHLISTKVTTRKKLAISGGSNGGLLVGAVMVKRPDLFNSVVCGVPLLDMLRYSKLLAGASWMAEYGDPDDQEMREYILTYSPYQNVRKNIQYPKVLFMTSTKDDRVHPGHARKMAAKMIDQGHKGIDYYENMEGGHSASSNLKQTAKKHAIKYNFLRDNLFNE